MSIPISRENQQDVSANRIGAALDEALARLEASQRAKTEPIAVVGLGCRWPGADSPDAFWRLLHDGVDAITDVPGGRWNVAAYFNADRDVAGTMYTRRGGFLSAVDGFDARFFEISPREAASIDPQHRLLLEVAWEALEHGGIAPDDLAGSATGVFVGVTTSDYGNLLVREGAAALDAYFSTGNASNAAPGRLAHVLGLQGPCLAVDTACSSSLVAVHLACQSLRAGECDMALAGGINLMLAPEVTIALCRARMLAADGRCKTFDASADGYVRGEGCGVVVLKRRSDALATGSPVLALIRGSATNQDGATAGFTVPNGRAQEALIRRALANAGVEARHVDYLEAHGTGTPLGDPIEVQAAASVFGKNRPADRPLLLGSVKTNIGHTEAAAGVAGLIKVVLALQHGAIPRHLNFHTHNPHICWSGLPVAVAAAHRAWPVREHPRMAAVSSFGASGTNAHVIVEQAPAAVPRSPAAPDRPLHILALSAKTEPALRQLAGRFVADLAAHPDRRFADVCFTANSGRAHLPVRLTITAATGEQAEQRLSATIAGPVSTVAGESLRTAYLFTGQGSHYAGMGQQLYETQPGFRSSLQHCAEILRDWLDRPLLDVLFAPGNSWLEDTTYTQPALFALQFSLAELWRSWGVRPYAVMGHSIGEYAAACIAGVFSLEDGLWLVSQRGRLMGQLPAGGTMAVVPAAPDSVQAMLAGHAADIAIAAVNAAEQTVISGRHAAVEAILANFAASDVPAIRLRVSHAFHSPLMAPMLAAFAEVADRVRYRAPELPLVSNVTGELATADIATPDYWIRHIREPVRFADGIATLRGRGCTTFIEIGPGRTLLDLGRRCLSGDGSLWLPSLRSGAEWDALLGSLGQLYGRGASIDWQGFDRDYPRSCVALPTYPWQRERHWRPSPPQPAAAVAGVGVDTPMADDDLLYEVTSLPQPPPAAPAATFWPPLSGLAGQLQPWLDQLAPDYADVSYSHALAQLEDRCIDYVAEAWRQLGWTFDPGTHSPAAELAERLGVIERHQPLLTRLAEMLAEAGWLRRVGDVWEVSARPEVTQPSQRVALLAAECPAASAECTLLDRAARRLADVLRGALDPLHLLFPDGDATAVGAVYRDSPGAQLMNRGLQEAVAVALRQLPEGRTLRVLEIGAGTGGATAGLLSVLPSERTEYCFTDISPRFTAAARRQFGHQRFIHYRLLDIERSPAAQGFAGEAPFDLIVAANVLHATRDLRQSLAHIRSLASPGALLLLLEGTAPIRSLDLVFGLTDGWWRCTDDDARSGYPLISAQRWRIVLDGAGFRDAEALAPQGYGVLSRQAVILARAGDDPPSHWLILADQGGIGQRLAARHAERGGASTLVYAGQGALVQSPCERVGGQHIIHLWGLDEPDLEQETAAGAANQAGLLSCTSAAELIRAVTDAEPAPIWLVTRGATGAAPAEPLPGLAQSALWGLGRVIAQEHPELRARRVDLDPAADLDGCVTALWSELCSGTAEDEVRWRGGARTVARLARSTAAAPAGPISFRAQASYLITGGLGGLGLLTAKFLAARGARTLVLAGRGAPDARAQQACRELEADGVRVVVRQVDVARRPDVERMFAEIDRSLPPLRGIVHAAGVLDDGMVRNLDRDRFAHVLAPKLAGAWHLHQLAEPLALDFFVLYSSFTAVLGTPGQGNHAAANAFLDALAWHRRGKGLPALSIDWGAWSNVGAAAQRQIGERLRYKGSGLLTLEQALRVLERVWHAETAQIAVVPIHWQELEQQQLRRPLLAGFSHPPAAETEPPKAFLAYWAAAPPLRQRSLLLQHVLSETAEVLGSGAAAIDPAQGFFQLGMDSLTSVELRNRLRLSLQCELPTTLAFDHPSPQALADFLLAELGAAAPLCQVPEDLVAEDMRSTAPMARTAALDGLSVAELENLIDELTGAA
jgi:acyl transferase domain-containing protein